MGLVGDLAQVLLHLGVLRPQELISVSPLLTLSNAFLLLILIISAGQYLLPGGIGQSSGHPDGRFLAPCFLQARTS